MSKLPARSLISMTLATALLAGCSDATGPGAPSSSTRFGTAMSFTQFDSTLGTGSTRIEISLIPGGLEAREVHVEVDDAEEKIVSQVTAIDSAAGTITLALGGMQVSYGSATRFRTPSQSRVTRSEWESAIASALAGGQQPPIEARRHQPAQPQAPGDGAFLAADLRLAARTDAPKMEVYVDGDNLQNVASPPPIAILTVFNLPIEITSGTRVSLTSPGGVPSGVVEFSGNVSAADPSAGTLTLDGGVLITVGSITFDPTGDLLDLTAAASAVSAGQSVRAEGSGTATSGSAITAQSIKVEVDN